MACGLVVSWRIEGAMRSMLSTARSGLALQQEDREHFRHRLQAYVRLYSFLTHILPFADRGLTKLYEYGRFLLRKMPHGDDEAVLQIDNYVDLRYYRLAKVGDFNLTLRDEDSDGHALPGMTAVGTDLEAVVGPLRSSRGRESA